MILQNKNDRLEKKDWTSPDFYVLDFKETKGGENPEQDEDDEYDTFSFE